MGQGSPERLCNLIESLAGIREKCRIAVMTGYGTNQKSRAALLMSAY